MNDFDERARKAAEGVRRALEESDVDLERGAKRAKRPPMARAAIPGTIAVVALLAGIFTLVPNDNGVKLDNGDGTFALAGELKPFGQCDAALEYFKTHAPNYLMENTFTGGGGGIAADSGARSDAPVTTMPNSSAELSADGAAPSAGKSMTDAQVSTTNVAEKGVDEPDIVKTDGKIIVTVTNGLVRILDVNAGNPVPLKTLELQNVSNVFLEGSRLVVFSGSPNYHGYFGPVDFRRPLSTDSTITLYDIGNPSNPAKVSSLDIVGGIIDARLVGTGVRVVTAYTPDVDTESPQYGPNGQLTEQSKQKLRDAINKTSIDSWLPSYKLRDASGAIASQGRLIECDNIGHPTDFSGIDTVGLLTFDMSKSLNERKTAGVVAGGQQIYATADNLYVTSSTWANNGRPSETDIHEFTTDESGSSAYRGSGTVPGRLLNQYSMSEHNGALRIATTVSGERGWVRRTFVSEGIVTVLQLKDGELQQVGFVGGLGKEDNESIQSVRFVGDKGYVTTYRQTDPLYVIDLKEATQPKIAGELKIEGFSGYLHPINNNLLLGVGQSGGTSIGGGAEGDGGTVKPLTEPATPPETTIPSPDDSSSSSSRPRPDIAPIAQAGIEFSLFDVSNPAAPRKIGSKIYGAGAAGAQYDPKAFLYWAPRNLIVAPVNEYGTWDYNKMQTSDSWSGLVLLRATENGLTEVGKLKNVDAQYGNVNRSFVINDNVYQLSDIALQVNNLDSHKDIARLLF